MAKIHICEIASAVENTTIYCDNSECTEYNLCVVIITVTFGCIHDLCITPVLCSPRACCLSKANDNTEEDFEPEDS